MTLAQCPAAVLRHRASFVTTPPSLVMEPFFLKDLDAEPSEPGVQSAHRDEVPVADLESLGLAATFLYGTRLRRLLVVLWSFLLSVSIYLFLSLVRDGLAEWSKALA